MGRDDKAKKRAAQTEITRMQEELNKTDEDDRKKKDESDRKGKDDTLRKKKDEDERQKTGADDVRKVKAKDEATAESMRICLLINVLDGDGEEIEKIAPAEIGEEKIGEHKSEKEDAKTKEEKRDRKKKEADDD